MPEGHTLHRHARIQTKELGGKTLRVSSPQGWAAEAAAALDGRALQKIDAHGKHLLYRFGDAQALHVHLGLFGRFRSWKGLAPPPRETTRLRFDAGERGVDLSGATASELIDADAEAKLLARLGPDPLRADADPERAWRALDRRRIPIAAALLDQRLIAGIGNVYRAEILFACGLDPFTPARELTAAQRGELWETTRALMRAGERSGRIVTVPAAEADGPPSKLRGSDRVQVYRRDHCRRCGGPVGQQVVAARTLFWCPAEQVAGS